MNEYEISELEGRDLECANCGAPISTDQYLEYEGLCECCYATEALSN